MSRSKTVIFRKFQEHVPQHFFRKTLQQWFWIFPRWKTPNLSAVIDSLNASSNPSDTTILTTLCCFPSSVRISFWAWADVRAKITHALPNVRDLRTSGNGCYQSPPFLRPRDRKKRRLWGREWPDQHYAVCIAQSQWLWLVFKTFHRRVACETQTYFRCRLSEPEILLGSRG